jgi:hydroxypyruvate reductase
VSAKRDLRQLFAETLQRVRIDEAIARCVRVEPEGTRSRIGDEAIDLHRLRSVRIVAFGKAARPMAHALVERLARPGSSGCAPSGVGGILVVPHDERGDPVPGLRELRAGHPLPDAGSFAAAEAIVGELQALGEEDLVFFLISGGGSALVERPLLDGVSPAEWAGLYRVLVGSGAGIVEINTVRKHLSAVKGGRLAQIAHPARQVTLYVSDVPPGFPSAVASGPTMPDETRLERAENLLGQLASAGNDPGILARLLDSALEETPKPGAPCFGRASWHCLQSNDDVVEAAADLAHGRGWTVEVDRSVDEAEIDGALDPLLDRLQALRRARPRGTAAVIAGGEVRCRVTGDGIGGRNQAFVLRATPRIAGEPITVLSAGTDGIDGNSPAAGAVADGETLSRARAKGLDPVDHDRRSDSYTFFDALGDTLVTGMTRQNLRDLRILAAGPTR